jgi:hypothetical protein
MYKMLSAAALAAALGFIAAPASAAPLALRGAQVGASASAAEPAAYRRCWYEDGRRHCRRTVTRYYYDDDGYYGYGPGLNLYFGGGGHRHGHFGHGHGHGGRHR